ncbi:ABC transporter substrate-binding protein [Clostridium sp. JNZ X4-2]
MLKKKIVSLGLLFVMATGLFTACGNKQNVSQSKSNSKELFEIKYPKLLFSDPVYIADQKGFFKEQGIKITFTGTVSQADMITSVASGANTFGGTSASSITLAIAKGVKIKAVAAGWASTPKNPSVGYVVRADSPIKSIKDLKGKKIATTPHSYQLLNLLEKAGLKESDVTVVPLSFDQEEAALVAGSVDVIEVLPPYLTKIVKTGVGRILIDGTQVSGEQKGWPQQFTSADFIKKHPDIVKKYTTAIAKACDWARANPKEAGKIFVKVFNVPDEYADYYTAAYPEHGLVSEKDAQFWIDQSVKYGDLKKGRLKTSDVYTNEFNPYYKKN